MGTWKLAFFLFAFGVLLSPDSFGATNSAQSQLQSKSPPIHSMADAQQLNPISCKRSAAIASCRNARGAKNKASNVYMHSECHGDPLGPLRTVDLEIALSTVLQRLERIEENCQCHGTHKPYGTLSGVNATPGDQSLYQSAPENAPDDMSDSVDSTSPSLDIPVVPPCSATPASEDQQPLWAALGSGVYILQHAVDGVQRGIIHHQSTLSRNPDDFHIEPDLAKSWIHSYFTHLSEDLFPEFLNVQLIQLMPDIVGLPNVHIDASIFVVYYCILYHGYFLHARSTPATDCATIMSKLYHRCLRALSAWELHATGTAPDFIAAYFMVRVAAERFDTELSWNMFKRACQYAESIGLHRLDKSTSPILAGLEESGVDAGRKGFWELFTMDAFFHLIHNKPLVIVRSWCEAKVNLPWLTESGLRTETATKTRFLIDSRRTFILIEFFQLLESSQAKPDPELVPKTEALCRDIDALYEEWSIGEWVRKMIASDGQLWTIAGVALEGYTCILAMLRHVDGPDIARLPLALKSSRHIVEVVGLILEAFPSPQDYRADSVLLERVARGLEVISKDVAELVPLAAAVENLNVKRQLLYISTSI
ncbi:hypothetical protein NM208_g621 [Fusarium decemcellulare]|uniref:Uncharacterized protein n=1 Tax=Fusarium decemcellulare TaxID=57161 RepID=A0ACC1SZ76_9HYPO|nr:hypothetical protein NM208_g621 [Fusarium decemcellulare]